MPVKLTNIQVGESLPFLFDRGENSIDGWICTIFLKVHPDDATILQRVVPPVNNQWPGFLTQSETNSLTPSGITPYYLIAKLTNSSTDEEEIITEDSRFWVSLNWV